MLNCFHPSAEWGYELAPDGTIKIVPTNLLKEVTAFCQRWNIELSVSQHPQFLAAYALASSAGDPEFLHWDRAKKRAIWKIFPETMLHGNPREVFADHGLFAIPLPTARTISKNMNLTRADMLNPMLQFAMAEALTISVLTKAKNDPLLAAIALHHGDKIYSAANKFRVQYRGNFPEMFIAYYNSYAVLTKQEKIHEQQAQTD